MSIYEISILVIVGIALVMRLLPRIGDGIKKILPIIAGVLIPIQLIVDGYRWQMMPIYVLTGVLIIVSLMQYRKKRDGKPLFKKKALRVIATVITVMLFIGAVIFPLLLPIMDLPEPSGMFDVGTTRIKMVDDRDEPFTEDNGDVRELVVDIWYPAEIDEDDILATYWDKEGVQGKAYSLSAGMGTFWYSHLNKVETNSYIDAKVSDNDDMYPVVIYSPSFWGYNNENNVIFETLASRGYIVVSVSHSYEMVVSLFPDGTAIYNDLSYIEETIEYDPEYESQLYKDYYATKDTDTRTELMKKVMVCDEQMSSMIDYRVDDCMFVMEELGKLNETAGLFEGKIDIDSAGIMGWSFGGATAMDACLYSDQFKVAVNMDGWPYGRLSNTEQQIEQPFMLINGESTEQMDDIVNQLIYDKAAGDAYWLTIEGVQHGNFSDFPLFFKSYSYLGYWGKYDALRMNELQKSAIVGFFDKYLKGQDVDIVAECADYEELTIEHK